MNFYALGPIGLLNHMIGERYPYHMVLAQYLYDDDFTPTDYFMYYKRRCALNGFKIILDNGVYEKKKVSYDLLTRATIELNPHVVVLPDSVNNMGATLDGGEAFKVLLKRQGWKGKTMTVVQFEPGNIDQGVHAYMEACKQSAWVGFPRNGVYGELSRAGFAKELVKRKVYNTHTTHHALGMKDGSLTELAELTESGLFAGCDSSAPLWRGLHGCAFESEWSDITFDPNNLGTLKTGYASCNWKEVQAACK